MKAVILAAGRGERLGGLTADRPKALVSLRGMPLIDYTLDFLVHHPFSEIIVVGGAFLPLLSDHLKNRSGPIRLVNNPHFEQGNIVSLMAATEYLNEEFLLMNADHIYPKRLLPALVSKARDITAVCDFNRTLGEDDMKIELDGERKIRRIAKRLERYDGGYIGMTWCGYEHVTAYLKALQATLSRKGTSAVVEDILQTLADQGHPARIFDASPYPWFEIDTPAELIQTEQILSQS